MISALLVICPIVMRAQVVIVRCEYPIPIYNNHVGNEWSFNFEFNGQFYGIEQPLQLSIAAAKTVGFVVFEENEKYPDKASVLLRIDPAKMILTKEYTKDIEVIITETNGRYSGNKAKWMVRIFYKLINDRT